MFLTLFEKGGDVLIACRSTVKLAFGAGSCAAEQWIPVSFHVTKQCIFCDERVDVLQHPDNRLLRWVVCGSIKSCTTVKSYENSLPVIEKLYTENRIK